MTAKANVDGKEVEYNEEEKKWEEATEEERVKECKRLMAEGLSEAEAQGTVWPEVKVVEEKAVEETKEEIELRELKDELKVKEANLKNHLKRRDGGVFVVGPGMTQEARPIDEELGHRRDALRMREIEIQYSNPLRAKYSYEQNEEYRKLKTKLDVEGPGGLNAIKETISKVEKQKETIDKEIPELEKEIPELKAKIEKLEVKDELVQKEGDGANDAPSA